MNPGKVSSSFHPVPGLFKAFFSFWILLGWQLISRRFFLHCNIPQNGGNLVILIGYCSTFECTFTASNPHTFSMGFKVWGTSKFFVSHDVCRALSCWKMTTSSLNLSHSGNKYWSNNSMIYFDKCCFPSKKTSSDKPRKEMAAQTITEPPPKFLLKMFFWTLWHHANNI